MPKAIPEVLIVENQSGNIFIVESKGETAQVDKILRNSARKINLPIKHKHVQSEEMVIEEYLDEEYLQQLDDDELILKDESSEKFQLAFNEAEETQLEVKEDEDVVLKDHPYTTIAEHEVLDHSMQSMDDFNMLNEEDIETYTVEELFDQNDSKSKKQHHKTHQLTGKAACKYCETIFKNKEQRNSHECTYLQCDPRNFICRICNKELSKKTFSNHLHETLDCQYCSKAFINPRNLKTHIAKLHGGEEYVPPPSPKFKPAQFAEENDEHLDEETGFIVSIGEKKPKKKYPRKTGRYECDLCGRILKTNMSLKQHLLLHSKLYRFVCETCGERFTTRTGIMKHACLNRRRRRPAKDFRTEDVRKCKYCDSWFGSYEENKQHECVYQNQEDTKLFRCRYCNLEMSKNSYNKHMKRHLDNNEYICHLCDKKLANEASLQTHLSVHSGDKNYKCDKCSKCFINKTLLTRHSRFHGKEVPVYKCEICSRELATKYHLKTHYATVHGDLFACRICKESCESRDQLKEHYKNSHEPFVCSVCSKSFILERYLKMHSKLHNGNSTQFYMCPYCSNRKFSKRSIANHVFKTHREHFDAWRDENMDLI